MADLGGVAKSDGRGARNDVRVQRFVVRLRHRVAEDSGIDGGLEVEVVAARGGGCCGDFAANDCCGCYSARGSNYDSGIRS